MTDIDRNNNFRPDEKENKVKKRFTSVKNFFSDIIGKTGSVPLGLDGSVADERIHSEAKRNKRLGSMPSLFRSPHAKSKYNPNAVQMENESHGKLTPTMSVPASLTLPRAKVIPRSVLSTGSLNKSDVNENWLKPVRYRNYQDSNGSLDFCHSDLSLNSLGSSSQNLMGNTLPNSKKLHGDFAVTESTHNLPNTLPKRSSIANKKHHIGSYQRNRVRFSDDDLTRINNRSDNDHNSFATMKWSFSNSTDLRTSSLTENRDIGEKLDQNLKTHSENGQLHVGPFLCSVESSTAGNIADDDSVFVNKECFEEVMPSNDRSDARDKPAITVQIDHDKVFGNLTQNTRHKKPSPPSSALNDVKIRDKPKGRRSDAELIKHNSISSDVLHECFSTSFWDDSEALLSTDRIREIAESEAKLVVADFYYGDNEVRKWTKEITCNVRDKIRAYTGRQFKVVVNAFIGSLIPSQQHDTVNIAVRGLTEPRSDHFVVSAFEKDDMFISVTCVLIRNGSIS